VFFFYGAAYQKSQSVAPVLPERGVLELSSEQSVGDVWIAQPDRKDDSISGSYFVVLERGRVVRAVVSRSQ